MERLKKVLSHMNKFSLPEGVVFDPRSRVRYQGDKVVAVNLEGYMALYVFPEVFTIKRWENSCIILSEYGVNHRAVQSFLGVDEKYMELIEYSSICSIQGGIPWSESARQNWKAIKNNIELIIKIQE